MVAPSANSFGPGLAPWTKFSRRGSEASSSDRKNSQASLEEKGGHSYYQQLHQEQVTAETNSASASSLTESLDRQLLR